MENQSSIYRYEAEIFEIQIGDSPKPLKWRVGSQSFVPDVGTVIVSRIFLDSDGYNLNGFARMLVMAHPEGKPDYEYLFRSYPPQYCSVSPNGVSELNRLGFFSD